PASTVLRCRGARPRALPTSHRACSAPRARRWRRPAVGRSCVGGVDFDQYRPLTAAVDTARTYIQITRLRRFRPECPFLLCAYKIHELFELEAVVLMKTQQQK